MNENVVYINRILIRYVKIIICRVKNAIIKSVKGDSIFDKLNGGRIWEYGVLLYIVWTIEMHSNCQAMITIG